MRPRGLYCSNLIFYKILLYVSTTDIPWKMQTLKSHMEPIQSLNNIYKLKNFKESSCIQCNSAVLWVFKKTIFWNNILTILWLLHWALKLWLFNLRYTTNSNISEWWYSSSREIFSKTKIWYPSNYVSHHSNWGLRLNSNLYLVNEILKVALCYFYQDKNVTTLSKSTMKLNSGIWNCYTFLNMRDIYQKQWAFIFQVLRHSSNKH